jgi:hypothetical protein
VTDDRFHESNHIGCHHRFFVSPCVAATSLWFTLVNIRFEPWKRPTRATRSSRHTARLWGVGGSLQMTAQCIARYDAGEPDPRRDQEGRDEPSARRSRAAACRCRNASPPHAVGEDAQLHCFLSAVGLRNAAVGHIVAHTPVDADGEAGAEGARLRSSVSIHVKGRAPLYARRRQCPRGRSDLGVMV